MSNETLPGLWLNGRLSSRLSWRLRFALVRLRRWLKRHAKVKVSTGRARDGASTLTGMVARRLRLKASSRVPDGVLDGVLDRVLDGF